MHRVARIRGRLRDERGSAVVEFPMIAVLIVLIALIVIQAAVIMHTRNLITDAAVQGAHHASKIGADVEDGEARTRSLLDQRFGDGFEAEVGSHRDGQVITVTVSATLPLVGVFGPAGALEADGRALDEAAW